ncbi:MAG: MOSC domain-containing protein [Geodermatophilaceae bacterium]|nr:MOSC domain-containing protein [Geodermatophilaceae bacterium]
MVLFTGMEGDWQRNRKYHGGPQRALCLYSKERLDALAGEGHPVFPGALGENVTIAGLDWARVQPGARLRIGEVECEVTDFAVPCRNLQPFFRDGVFVRVGQKQRHGWSRAYARVLIEGRIAVDDIVSLEYINNY